MSDGQIGIAAARQIAADAVRLCLAGDEPAGLALYRSIATPDLFAELPVGLHVQMLGDAGRDGAAEALTALILAEGGDLAWKARFKGAMPQSAAAEYERFIAEGRANVLMINRYIDALGMAGRFADVAAIFDSRLLLQTGWLAGGDAVAQALLDREAGLEVGSRQSIRDMREVRKLGHLPEFAPLLATLRAETQAYYARWAASDHPLAKVVPKDFTIGAWGLISRGKGHNVRHNHPRGWATGVYYPAGLAGDVTGGSLCIGGWSDPAPAGWPTIEIRPEPEMLVLMPSYYVHWTRPLGGPGLRLAVAFDTKSA